MSIEDYLINDNVEWSQVLAPCHWLLPSELTVWLVNRFGDLFFVLDDGTVHLFDVGCGSIEQVAESRDDFCDKIDQDDNANQWLMVFLADQLVAAGKILPPGHCYSYVVSPVLGGEYTVENTMIIPIHEHYGLHAGIHQQIRDLPDGTPVRIRIEPNPGDSN